MDKESKLESLRLLFSTNFNDDDLLSILEEAQDDLDLAIARISEGQTETWELKKKKPLNTNRGRGRGGHRNVKHQQREQREPRDSRDHKESREPKVHKEHKEQRDQKELRESKESKEPREQKELKEPREQRESKEFKEVKKAGLVGVPEKVKFQKKNKKFEKTIKETGKTSWAQLVKGNDESLPNSQVLSNGTQAIVEVSDISTSVKSTAINSSTSAGVKINLNVAASVIKKIENEKEKKIITNNNNTKKSLVVTLSKQSQKEESKNENSNLPPGLLSANNSVQGKKSAAKQQEPVVMPSNSHMSSMGVQFGSLNQDEKKLAEKVAILDSKRIQTPLKGENVTPQNGNVPTGMNMMHSYPSMTPISYFQQVPGFGMMAPGNGADFQQVYGTDGVQGYYSNHYAKFPSGSQNAQPTTTTGTSQAPAAASQNPQQIALHQQQYAMPFGYYPYYMPNQFQSAPSYGAQFVNKNMYHYGPTVSGSPAAAASMTSAVLPASNTQSSSRNNAAPATAAAYPFVSAPPLYSGYDDSASISVPGSVPHGNVPFQNLNSGFAGQSNLTQNQAPTSNIRGSTSGSSTSGSHFSNQRPAYDKFSSSVSAQSANDSYYHPSQPAFGNQYQHQQHQQQQYYLQQQQPQQVVYGNNGAYGNVRSNQQNQQYWTATSNGGQ